MWSKKLDRCVAEIEEISTAFERGLSLAWPRPQLSALHVASCGLRSSRPGVELPQNFVVLTKWANISYICMMGTGLRAFRLLADAYLPASA